MAKGANQKKKAFLLLEFLEQETDENHVADMPRILEHLAANEVTAERKSIYDDMEMLNQLGYEICFKKSSPSGYYLKKRKFEIAELKLLVEAVQASRFLSKRKSDALIRKLESFCSRHEAGQLQRQVYVQDRVKTMNESIYSNVDRLHTAISGNSEISFHYLEWNAKKELVPRKNGKLYRVIPQKLVWFDENYYLVAIDKETEDSRHYRVDKMKDISIGACVGKKYESRSSNTATFAKKTFGMFDGEEVRVRMEAPKDLSGVFLDRFGTDIILHEKAGDPGQIEVGADVYVSHQFFGWVLGIGNIKIVGPERVKKEYVEYINRQLKLNGGVTEDTDE